LQILGTCRTFRGTVLFVRHEDDGDYHVVVRPDAGYQRFLNHDNYRYEDGGLVTEIMPGQHFPQPFTGEHVAIFGTWVLDADHGWWEIHPIWSITDLANGDRKFSLPVVPPRYDGSTSGSAGGGGTGGGGGSNDCTPGYSPCLVYHGGADYDCYGGGGNGPYYTQPGVVYRVTGSDPYGLDANHDGYGC
jgi:hypothetical protein